MNYSDLIFSYFIKNKKIKIFKNDEEENKEYTIISKINENLFLVEDYYYNELIAKYKLSLDEFILKCLEFDNFKEITFEKILNY